MSVKWTVEKSLVGPGNPRPGYWVMRDGAPWEWHPTKSSAEYAAEVMRPPVTPRVFRCKVSGAGYMCMERTDGTWLASFKLTQSQLEEWKETVRGE